MALNSQLFLTIITTRKILFKPDIQTYKEIPAPHLLNLEFGFSRPPVAPGDGDYSPAVSTNNCLEGDFHCEVKVRGDQRPTAVDDIPSVSLEGVCGIVETDFKQEF